jgi:muramoyltetrapeptide carboxypeptidase
MVKEWQPLKEGDTVRIIAPGSKVPNAWEELKKACDFLRTIKLNPVYSKNIFSDKQDTRYQFYNFANTDEKRYEDFVDAIQSDAQAVWCFRGGYGSDRVLRQAVKNSLTPQTTPKLFIGFSDITNLHNFMNSQWQWSTLHGASIRQLGNNEIDPADVKIIEDIIFGTRKQIKLELLPLNQAARNPGKITGEISGGNLTVIQSALGTEWEMPVNEKIVLFEDVDEAPYRVSRMLQQFLASNHLTGAKAIILGDFIHKTKEPTEDSVALTPMDFVLQEFADQCPLPVLRYAGIGHGSKNYPIPFATPTELTVGDEPELISATGATT